MSQYPEKDFPYLLAPFVLFYMAHSKYVSFTNPNPTPKSSTGQTKMGDYTTLHIFCLRSYVYTCCVHCIIEAVLITVVELDYRIPNVNALTGIKTLLIHLLQFSDNEGRIAFTRVRMVGGFLLLAGGALRQQCFRELGRQFTFQVSILEKHSLTTSGPYSYVRHPSYTAVYIMNVGAILFYGAAGSWLRESEVLNHPFTWIILTPSIMYLAFIPVVLFRRISEEDRLLKNEFGQQWIKWSNAVPYRLVPGVY